MSAASVDGGSSPIRTLVKTLTGSSTGGGLGWLLPAVLIVSVVGGGVLARRRTTT